MGCLIWPHHHNPTAFDPMDDHSNYGTIFDWWFNELSPSSSSTYSLHIIEQGRVRNEWITIFPLKKKQELKRLLENIEHSVDKEASSSSRSAAAHERNAKVQLQCGVRRSCCQSVREERTANRRRLAVPRSGSNFDVNFPRTWTHGPGRLWHQIL